MVDGADSVYGVVPFWLPADCVGGGLVLMVLIDGAVLVIGVGSRPSGLLAWMSRLAIRVLVVTLSIPQRTPLRICVPVVSLTCLSVQTLLATWLPTIMRGVWIRFLTVFPLDSTRALLLDGLVMRALRIRLLIRRLLVNLTLLWTIACRLTRSLMSSVGPVAELLCPLPFYTCASSCV